MADHEVGGTHTMISLGGAYLFIYACVCTYIYLYVYLSDRQVYIILERMPRGRRHLGEDELVTDTQP